MQIRRLLFSLVVYTFAAGPVLQAPAQLRTRSALSREKGAVYVEDATSKELKVRTLTEAQVFTNLRGERRLGVIPAGREVGVIAISKTALRVRGRALHDNVVGWIARTAATPLDPKLIDQLEAAGERRRSVDELIAKKEVAIGMTTEEVLEALGTPTDRRSRVHAQGREDSYEYITYRTITRPVVQYDGFGNPYYAYVSDRVETGRLTVDFRDGVVSAYSEREKLRRRGGQRLVAPPVFLHGW